MTAILVAAHSGYVRFNPILGSKDLALVINAQKRPGDLILIDGELTAGSSLLFYTEQKARLRHALRAEGLVEVTLGFDYEGTKIVAG